MARSMHMHIHLQRAWPKGMKPAHLLGSKAADMQGTAIRHGKLCYIPMVIFAEMQSIYMKQIEQGIPRLPCNVRWKSTEGRRGHKVQEVRSGCIVQALFGPLHDEAQGHC